MTTLQIIFIVVIAAIIVVLTGVIAVVIVAEPRNEYKEDLKFAKKLRVCYCGMKPQIVREIDNSVYIHCSCCGARTRSCETLEEARNEWNYFLNIRPLQTYSFRNLYDVSVMERYGDCFLVRRLSDGHYHGAHYYDLIRPKKSANVI